jgi:chitinase
MSPPRITRTVINENKHPYVIELAFVSDELDSDALDIDFSRRIMQFHRSRHIQPRYGRTARDFAEHFGGEFCKPIN